MRVKTIIVCLACTLIVAAFVTPAPVYAQGRGSSSTLCDIQTPKVQVSLATSPTQYVRNKSSMILTSMHNKGDSHVGGLGGGEIGLKTQGKFVVRQQGSQACVSLTQVKVTLYAKPSITIASNFERGSCEYHAVLGHEQKHIRTLLRFVRLQAPKLRRQVQKIVANSPSFKQVDVGRAGQAQKDIQKNLTRQLEQYQNSILPMLEQEQIAIDNPEEYARVANMCRNWDKKLAAN